MTDEYEYLLVVFVKFSLMLGFMGGMLLANIINEYYKKRQRKILMKGLDALDEKNLMAYHKAARLDD